MVERHLPSVPILRESGFSFVKNVYWFSSVDGTITRKKGSTRWYFAATLPGFKVLYILAVGFWAPLCSFLSLNFLNCEMGL